MAATQVLRGSGESLRVKFLIDGVATDADAGVTVTVTRDDGTAIDTAAAATSVTTGVYAYSLAPQTDLDKLTLVWTGTFSGNVQTITTRTDVVGGYYVGLDELLAMPNLAGFTVPQLIDARQWFEEKFERYTGRAFVPRYKKITVWGHGTDTLMLPDQYISRVRSITFGTVSLGTQALANTVFTDDGRVERYWPYLSNATEPSWGVFGQQFPQGTRVTVAYEYGTDETPRDVTEAAGIAIRSKLLNDDTGRPMLSVSDGAGGTTRFATPGPDRPFGIPNVDVVANDRRRPDWQADRLTVGSIPIG